MVECDVHLSKDGQVVVMHDPNVSTTTDGSGLISELTLAELKKLNDAAKFADKKWSPQVVPTLGEVLDLVKGKVGIQIEIKNTATGGRYPGIEKQVIDLINARGMANDVIVISFDFPTLKEVKVIDSRIKTGALVRADWFVLRSPEKSVSDAIDPTGADYFMPTASPVNQQIADAAHARGIKMGVWTVDTPAEMKRYAGFGIDAITTNRPDDLKKALGR
jgi:glycerophosphoryl diester phosphodiesterase